MKKRVLLPFALLLGASPPPAPQTQAEMAVPQDHGPQTVLVQARTFAPGQWSGWHIHPGVEIGTVVSGETVMLTAAGRHTYRAGESFQIPRGTPHNGGNVAAEPARVVVTLVVDAGVPPRQPVPAP